MNTEAPQKTKDPYLKPVIFSGLFTTLLTILFAPLIFLWAGLGGYTAIRISHKTTKEIPSLLDSILIGLFTGLVGSTCINILAVITFKDPENERILIRMLEKNWPGELNPMPNFSEMLPSIFVTTCLMIMAICVLFTILGTYVGHVISKKKKVDSKK